MTHINPTRLFLPLALSLAMYLSPASAAPELGVSKAVGVPGASVEILVNYVGDGQVVTAQLDILFDESVLTPGAVVSNSTPPHALSANIVGPGKLRLLLPPVMQSPLPVIHSTLPIARIPFSIEQNASPGSEPLRLSNVVLGAASGERVSASNLINGEITIIDTAFLVDVPMLSRWGLLMLGLALLALASQGINRQA